MAPQFLLEVGNSGNTITWGLILQKTHYLGKKIIRGSMLRGTLFRGKLYKK
jgi:hypothetical protein